MRWLVQQVRKNWREREGLSSPFKPQCWQERSLQGKERKNRTEQIMWALCILMAGEAEACRKALMLALSLVHWIAFQRRWYFGNGLWNLHEGMWKGLELYRTFGPSQGPVLLLSPRFLAFSLSHDFTYHCCRISIWIRKGLFPEFCSKAEVFCWRALLPES